MLSCTEKSVQAARVSKLGFLLMTMLQLKSKHDYCKKITFESVKNLSNSYVTKKINETIAISIGPYSGKKTAVKFDWR